MKLAGLDCSSAKDMAMRLYGVFKDLLSFILRAVAATIQFLLANEMNMNSCAAEIRDQSTVCGYYLMTSGEYWRIAMERMEQHQEEQHEEECKKREEECKKRQAELHGDNLFKQPDGIYRGDCPICFLPMPLEKNTYWPCCSSWICNGCIYANYMSNKNINCPFCRKPASNDEGNVKRMMKRIKADDPDAFCQMGSERYNQGDHEGAVEYFEKAAELGDVEAHHYLGDRYYNGEGVEKDEEKAVHYYEKAAIGGHFKSRNNLGAIDMHNGNIKRSVKHFIIAANVGFDLSMKALWTHYSDGNITKEDLEATLRTHKAAIDAMKSEDRDAAAKSTLKYGAPPAS